MRRVTIRDVAREAGVSVTTVSVVLNNSDRPVRDELRARVIEVAERLNYHPSALARSLVRQKSNTIGIVLGEVEEGILGNYYAAGVLAGVFARAQRFGLDLHLFTMGWTGDRPAQRVMAQQPDGVLVVAPSYHSPIAPDLQSVGLPVVSISTPGDKSIPFVDIDNIAGTRLALQHLIDLGHTRIGHVIAGETQYSVFARRDEFIRFLKEKNIPVREDWLITRSFEPEVIRTTVKELLLRKDRPTALFCTNDGLALQTLLAASEAGVRVPEELSVIGFDDFPSAVQLAPPLTTVRQPFQQVGAEAVELLLERMAGGTNLHRYIIPELIIRSSTASLP
ncbi:MAG: LacI family DNA-binding transcriptional regulator [Armatimonas sp.]